MKITTVRTLLLVADLALVAGIGAVVTVGFKEKSRDRDAIAAYRHEIGRRLDARKSGGAQIAKGREYGASIFRANLSGRKAPVVEPPKPVAAPSTTQRPPLETLIRVIGIQTGPGDPPSIAYLVREDPAAAPGGKGIRVPRDSISRSKTT